MRKAMLAVLVSVLLVGPLASVASADHPVRAVFCYAAEKIGFTWVQDCNLE